MRIARVCRAKYPDLDGKGAAIKGGRWNSPGTPMVYASSCGALAVLEYRVHTSVNPDDLLIYTIEIPDTSNSPCLNRLFSDGRKNLTERSDRQKTRNSW